MNVTTSYQLAITLGLISLFAVAIGAEPLYPLSATSSESVESRPGGSHDTSRPARPKVAHPADPLRSKKPSDLPSQMPAPLQRTQELEERLRRGELDQPIAQGLVSDRLEQFHRGSADGSPDETVGQPVQ